MKITVIAVGKIKEKFFEQAVAEYGKRLGSYSRLEMVQVPDEKTPDGLAGALAEQVKEKEGARILSHVKDGAYVIALAVEGKMMSSEELADKIDSLGIGGVSHIQFIIGGSLGLSEAVMRRADFSLSFSRMTFPHQLMRVILLEQIYRSYRISLGMPYHK